MPSHPTDATAEERAKTTNDVISEILLRLQRGEAVTKDLLARIPQGTRVEMPLTVHGDGVTNKGVLIIQDGLVKFYPPGEWPS